MALSDWRHISTFTVKPDIESAVKSFMRKAVSSLAIFTKGRTMSNVPSVAAFQPSFHGALSSTSPACFNVGNVAIGDVISMIVTDSTANHLYRITSALTGATTAAISVERML